MSLKSRKAELKQRGKLSLAKYAGMIVATIRYIFTNTKPRIFRIPKKKALETLHRGVQIIITSLETIRTFKIVRLRA